MPKPIAAIDAVQAIRPVQIRDISRTAAALSAMRRNAKRRVRVALKGVPSHARDADQIISTDLSEAIQNFLGKHRWKVIGVVVAVIVMSFLIDQS